MDHPEAPPPQRRRRGLEAVRDRLRALALRLRGDHFTSPRLLRFYFNTFGLLTRVNYVWHRYVAPPKPPVRVHVGSGPKYLEGFVNIEGLPVWKADIRLDLRAGLPFKSGGVEALYCCHVLEHFDVGRIVRMLRECWRVLAPGGGFRIVVPSLERAITDYEADTLPPTEGSRFGRFESRGGRFNFEMLCDNNHPVMLDYSFLVELLDRSGRWKDVRRSGFGESGVLSPEDLRNAEGDRRDLVDRSLVVEGFKEPV
jgi:predicted SAM-dependent methyltransferase